MSLQTSSALSLLFQQEVLASLPKSFIRDDISSHPQESSAFGVTNRPEVTCDLGGGVDLVVHGNGTDPGVEGEGSLEVAVVEVLIQLVFREGLEYNNNN